MTRRKNFDDLKLDYLEEVQKFSGTERDKRQCEHGNNPKLGCVECWVCGWLFDDRRNPAHPFYRESENIVMRFS